MIYTTQHQAEIDGKKLLLGSELWKEYVAKKKEEIGRRQSLLRMKSCESLAMTAASYEIALTLAKRRKPFSDGEEIVKPCLNIFAKRIGDKNIESKVAKIALSKQTITRRIEELSYDVSNQLKDLVHSCTYFSLALDESTDICDIPQYEELVSLESLHGRTRGSDIFDKMKSCLENLQLDSSKLISVH